MLFRNESIEQKKIDIYNHINDVNEYDRIYGIWDVINNLPNNFISNILYLSNQPVFNYSYVDRETNMFDSIIMSTTIVNLSNHIFRNDEYYIFHYMNDASVRVYILDECETNKYFDNYIIEKRDITINEILK
tara:strand:+ start:3222 stop:3617 length:396 start_codon:yes stop_codon:yes gene_type:complete